jgi:hypothetical protein
MYMANDSIFGILNFRDIIGSSYVAVLIAKQVMACVSRKGLVKGVKFWSHFVSGMAIIVMAFGLYCATNFTQ